MDNETCLLRLASAVERFTRVIERSELDQLVPACPGWDVAALVDHVVVVHSWVSRILADGEIFIEPDAAADGIDELLTLMGSRLAQRGIKPDLTAPLAIVPTDSAESWTVHPPGRQRLGTGRPWRQRSRRHGVGPISRPVSRAVEATAAGTSHDRR